MAVTGKSAYLRRVEELRDDAPPAKPSLDRRRKLNELAAWQRQWVRDHLDDSTFTPRAKGSDYPLHSVTVDASGKAADEFHAKAREILGI